MDYSYDSETKRQLDWEASGANLLHQEHFKEYYPPQKACQFVEQIFEPFDYYLIESDVDTGKTAFISYVVKQLLAHKQDDVKLAVYVFRHHDRPSVRDAIRSLRRQLARMNNPEAQVLDDLYRLDEDISAVTEKLVAKEGKLLILIDALDECDRVDLQHLLPADKPQNTTIIVTSRRPAANILEHLPKEHQLKYATPQPLAKFTETDILEILQKILGDKKPPLHMEQLAGHIHEYTESDPQSVLNLCRIAREHERGDLLQKLKAEASKTASKRWERELSRMEIACLPKQRPLLRKILALCAVARSSLSLSDLSQQLHVDPFAIELLMKAQTGYIEQQSTSHYRLISDKFRVYLTICDHYQKLVAEARVTLRLWARTYLEHGATSRSSQHLIQHAAEYLADDRLLKQLLITRDWFEAFPTWRARLEALRQARLMVEQRRIFMDDETYIANLILCYLMVATCRARLLPEHVVQLVDKDGWSKEQARDYAALYVRDDAQQEVEDSLEKLGVSLPAEQMRRSLHEIEVLDPADPHSAQEYKRMLWMLNEIKELDWTDRQREYDRWIRQYERLVSPDLASDEQDLLEALSNALVDVKDQYSSHTRWEDQERLDFSELLEEMKQLSLEPTELPSRRYFNTFTMLMGAWQQHSSLKQLPLIRLGRILQLFDNVPRSHFLQALSTLLPALARHYLPSMVDDLHQSIRQIVERYP